MTDPLQALAKLLTETAQDRGCTVCYTDAAVKAELEAARATLGAERTAAFDKLGVSLSALLTECPPIKFECPPIEV